MKRRIITFISAVAITIAAVAAPVVPAYADPKAEIQAGLNQTGGTGKENLTLSVRNIIDVVLFALGMVAVIMIIVGGFRYVLSAGDSSSITAAKNTILYAVIGLVVAILAYAIVHFVVTSIK